MPIIKSAKKKLRQDKKRTLTNKTYETKLKKAIHAVKAAKGKSGLAKLVATAYSVIDRAAKSKVIHKGRADRLKSRISRFTAKK